jgi:hypothetical protein
LIVPAWLTNFLTEYGAWAASLSALALGAFNLMHHWMENKQKSKLEVAAKREINKIEIASQHEKERIAIARQFEIDKLSELQTAISTVNRLRDRLRSIVASNDIKDYVSSKVIVDELRDLSSALDRIHGMPVVQLVATDVLEAIHQARRMAQSACNRISRNSSGYEQFPVLDETTIESLTSDIQRLAFVRDKLNEAFLSEVVPLVRNYRSISPLGG